MKSHKKLKFFPNRIVKRNFWDPMGSIESRKLDLYKNMSMSERFQDYKDIMNEFTYLESIKHPLLKFSNILPHDSNGETNDHSEGGSPPNHSSFPSNLSNDGLNRGPINAAYKITKIFSKYEIPVVIGGSLAMMCYTQPRATKDLDVNLLLPDMTPDEEKKLLKKICEENGIDFLSYSSSMVPKKHTKFDMRMSICLFKIDQFPIDVFITKGTPVYEKLFRDAKVVEGLKFAPLECLLFWKMISIPKDKDSENYHKVMLDIHKALKMNGDMDKAFVRERLAENFGENSFKVKEWERLTNKYAH